MNYYFIMGFILATIVESIIIMIVFKHFMAGEVNLEYDEDNTPSLWFVGITASDLITRKYVIYKVKSNIK